LRISSGIVILPPAVTSAKKGMSSSVVSVGTKRHLVFEAMRSTKKSC
jgi:hypothetical protein